MAKAVKSFETHTMDFTSRVQIGVTASADVYVRVQERHPRYGYRWTKWRLTTATATEGLCDRGPQKWRLPGTDSNATKAAKKRDDKFSCTDEQLNAAMDKLAQELGPVRRG